MVSGPPAGCGLVYDMRMLLPPPGVPRALALQSMLYAVGSGTFMAGSAVFFTRVVGLTARQGGLGLSVAGGVALLLALWVDTRWAYYALALCNSAMLLVNAVFVARLPLPSGPAVRAPRRGNPLGALKDRPFLLVALLSGVLLTESTVFAVVVPLWVVNRTDAPRPI